MKTMHFLAALMILYAVGVVASDVPLRQVTLFTSGVGHFERSGEVKGEHVVELHFRQDQINDVIKTLVAIDQAGQVRGVTYDARDPLERTLQSFAVQIGDNPSLGDLLNRLRGVPVRVTVSARDITGSILGVERRTKKEGDVTFTEHVLNLLTPQGLRPVPLNDVQELDVRDSAVAEQLEAALAAIAGRLDQTRKGVRIHFDGEGMRRVRTAYMLETPVWKTSYRLVLNEEDALLQGWAHVENVTDEDWLDVHVSLVSGRPISFIQNLYDPIYAQRPVVRQETRETTAPPVFAGEALAMAAAPARARRAQVARMEMDAAVAEPSEAWGTIEDFGDQAAVAVGEQTGELFQYQIETPVSMPRQSSAMLPIVQTSVSATPVSVYNETVNAKHPLNAAELENTSDAYLMQGPVAVFEGGIYAGDARLPDTRQGARRLLGYAVDLATEVIREAGRPAERVVQVRIANGIMEVRQSYLRRTTYRIRSERDTPRALIIEHPYQSDWTLLKPEGEVDRTATHHRLRTEAKPLGARELEVEEENIRSATWQMATLDPDRIEFFLQQRVLTPAQRDALETLAGKRRDLAVLQRDIRAVEQSINEITAEQGRIRENMRVVQRGTESFSMWERKLIEQERELEGLRSRLRQRREEEKQKATELADWVAGLNLE